jgi:hypothetical protein
MLNGTLQKIKDTGSEDPFNARLMFEIFSLRDKMVKSDQERLLFDNFYNPILETMEETEDAFKNVVNIINNHKAKVENGSIIKFQHDVIEVSESIDKELKKNFKDFFVKGNRAMDLLVPFFKNYGYSIGFVFKNDKDFLAGARKFSEKHNEEKHSNFLKMIEADRKLWLPLFVSQRQEIEHEGTSLPGTKYMKTRPGEVAAVFPKIDGIEITELLKGKWWTLFEFVEDCVVALIDFKLEDPWIIVQIPEGKRDITMPLKYTTSVKGFAEFLEAERLKKSQ